MNLDLPPKQRWTHIAQKYGKNATIPLNYIKKLTGPGAPLHGIVQDLLTAVLSNGAWSQDNLDEMAGIAATVDPIIPGGVTVQEIQAANLFYELTTFCTSIVAQHANGTILHSRNQDYSPPGLSDIVMDVEFHKGGKPLYVGTTFAGYIGLPTAHRFGGWSVSADSRFDDPLAGIFKNIASAKKGGQSVGMFLRDLAATKATFDDVLPAFNATRLIAPAYFVVAGANPGEGAVVTRNRTHAVDDHGGTAQGI